MNICEYEIAEMLPASSLQHCTAHRKGLASSLLLGIAWWRMDGIWLSAGLEWEGQRPLTYSLSPTNPRVFLLADAKVTFHCLVSLRYTQRLCFPLSLLDITNSTELLTKSIFWFPKQAMQPQDSQEDAKSRRYLHMMINNQVILS